MVVEVNKLIANALLSNGGIYLPDIGSLSIVTSTPEGGDPTRDIVIVDGERHKSLITVISERGNCTLQQAEQVYKRWLLIVTREQTTTILGIGEIEDGKFKSTPQMFNKLNPVQARKSVNSETKVTPPAKPETKTQPKSEPKPKRAAAPKTKDKSKNGYSWAFVVAIVITIGVTYFALKLDDTTAEETQTEVVAVEQPRSVTESHATTSEPPQPEEEKPQPQKIEKAKVDINADPTAVLYETIEQSKSSTAKYRVVFGVFSSPSNSGRAIIKMVKEGKNDDITVRAYPYGKETYMLTVFESDSASECEKFKKSKLGLSISQDLCVYAKK